MKLFRFFRRRRRRVVESVTLPDPMSPLALEQYEDGRTDPDSRDTLSGKELEWMMGHSGRCPDCGTGELISGKSVGIGTDCRCRKCGSGFRLVVAINPDRILSMSHRLGKLLADGFE